MGGEMVQTTVDSVLLDIGSVFTEAITWAGDVGKTIVETPLLMLFCAIPLVGLGVGLFRRLINVN